MVKTSDFKFYSISGFLFIFMPVYLPDLSANNISERCPHGKK
jgi:hypothetical protein